MFQANQKGSNELKIVTKSVKKTFKEIKLIIIQHKKNITNNTRACSTCGKIKYKILLCVPYAEKCNTKYQSAFHTWKNITQNISALSTQREI